MKEEQSCALQENTKRPSTQELVDLHIYVVPSDSWIEKRKLAKKDVIDQAISSGFVRILPSTTLSQLRSEIQEQLGSESAPEVYVFLRSVGRNFTQVRARQEHELKVKSFIPPYAEEPELYVKLGEYVALRSASLGSDAPLRTSSGVPLSDPFVHSLGTAEAATQSANFQDGLDLESAEGEKRSRSWDRTEPRIRSMVQHGRSLVPNRRLSMNRISPRRTAKSSLGKVRPPTPRVKERFTGSSFPHRQRHVNTTPREKCQDCITENHKEVHDDDRNGAHSLEIQASRETEVNSPPPKPGSNCDSSDSAEVHLIVPELSGGTGGLPATKEVNSNTGGLPETTSENEDSKESSKDAQKENASESVQHREENQITEEPGSDATQEEQVESSSKEATVSEESETYCITSAEDNKDSTNTNSPTSSSEDSKLALDIMDGEVNDENVIVDPIKLLQGEGNALKGGVREHYDEGFHSGELVASEEEQVDDQKIDNSSTKPDRAGTPMPRTAYYRVIKNNPESENLLLLKEQLHSERRLRELKRDTLMQKVRDLQKRKDSTSDRAREEYRKRYLEVKKLTPRLEDHCTKLRQELERLVREMLVNVPVAESDSKPHKPSKKTSYEIMIMRLLQEVEDLRRRLQSVTVRLNAETKLRSQAESEVKRLRKDLLQKKTQVTLTRKQTAFPRPQSFFISAV